MKVQYLSLIAISLLTIACGRKPVLEVGEFAPYVERFEQRSAEVGAPIKVMDLVMSFGQLENPRENGVCELVGDETPKIIISKTKWDRMDDAKRESLVFHEMGHCVLHRKHKDGYTDHGVPVSLMNPYALDSDTYLENESYYIQELFLQQI